MTTLFPFTSLFPALSLPGLISPGAKMAFYLTGTTTLAAVYDEDGDPISQSANLHGIVGVEADAFGRFPNIYTDDAVTYRVRLRTALGVQLGDDIDPYQAGLSGGTGADHVGYQAPGTGTQVVTAATIFKERVRLLTYLTPAELTAVATQDTSAASLSTKINQMILDANGRECWFPKDGLANVDATIGRITANATTYTEGVKLIGDGGNRFIINSRVSNGPAVRIDTNAVLNPYFIRGNVFENLHITGQTATPTNGSGLSGRHAIDSRCSNVLIDYFQRDGFYSTITEGDTDGCNNWLWDEDCLIDHCQRWGVNQDPQGGHTEFSYLYFHGRVDNCGIYGYKAITGITKASPAVVTATAHGFANGDLVTLFAVGGMVEISYRTFYAKVLSANTIGLYSDAGLTSPIDSSSYSTYTSGGAVGPMEPASGGIKWGGQLADFNRAKIVLCQNAGILLTKASAVIGTTFGSGTIENCTGIPLHINSALGLRNLGTLDIRNSDTFKGFASVWMDSTVRSISEIDLGDIQVVATSGNSPHRAFEGTGQNLANINIHDSQWRNGYDFAGQARFGPGLFGALNLTITDDERDIFKAQKVVRTTLSGSSPTYKADIRNGPVHRIILDNTVTGTLTIDTPTIGDLSGITLDGAEYKLVIMNNSGVSITLAYSIGNNGAPTTIANNAVKTGQWTYYFASGWVQSSPWL